MKTEISSLIAEGKIATLWKEPGIYTLDFPSVSIRIAEDQMGEVIEDLENMITAFKKTQSD